MDLSAKDDCINAIEAVDAASCHVEFVFAEEESGTDALESALAMLSAGYAEKSIVR